MMRHLNVLMSNIKKISFKHCKSKNIEIFQWHLDLLINKRKTSVPSFCKYFYQFSRKRKNVKTQNFLDTHCKSAFSDHLANSKGLLRLLQCVLAREQVGKANIMSQMEISTALSYYLHSLVTLLNQLYLE